MSWNPAQYEQFREERRQPFLDLLSLVERRPGMRVLDLGCGTGELTRFLHEELGASETLGVDSSEEMLSRSESVATKTLRFAAGRIESFHPDGRFDLVLSNAALHWVVDHTETFARLASFLTAAGQLAVQMPANDSHASHRVAAAVAGRYSLQPRPDPLLLPERYATLLYSLGFKRQNVRMQIYGHELPSSRDVVKWVKGSLLTEYERQLSPSDYARFLEEYEHDLLEEIGERAPYLYTYRRILIWGSILGEHGVKPENDRHGCEREQGHEEAS